MSLPSPPATPAHSSSFLALIYIVRGFFTRTLDEATAKSLARMIYGIVCFATLFSFVGTVLGGIWADQSGAAFGAGTPRKTALSSSSCGTPLILHLRWGGMIRERGLVNCAIFGNIVTSWSWFGVNMLGIGLHSYGFTEAAFKWLNPLSWRASSPSSPSAYLPVRLWSFYHPPAGGELLKAL